MTRKIFFVIILLSTALFAQNDYVKIDNNVYQFLERMEALHIISDYNSFEIPKPREEIAHYLKEVISNESRLDKIDHQILHDLKTEFEFDMYGTLNNSQSYIDSTYDLFSQKAKYFYSYVKPDKINLFVNLVGEGQVISQNDFENKTNLHTEIGVVGGELRGTLFNKFGFYLRGTNGNVFGNKTVAELRPDIKYNFKYSLDQAAGFFDETEGYLTADFNYLKLKFGRDQMQIGYGPIKSIIDDNSPEFDYLGMNIDYDFFHFSYFHGKLLGESYFQPDSIQGGINVVAEKYIGYHRISFDVTKKFNFGAGEMIIYGDRPMDLSYLNPFAFYKSVEHSGQDRDNSFLFFDAVDRSFEGLKIYSTLLIDDIDFGKIGTGWYGNQTLFDIGIFSSNLYKILPMDFGLEFTKVDPYVHTHRTANSNFTNLGYNLGSILKPNSEMYNINLNYRLTYRINLAADFSYILHGANPVKADGTIINVGGDESLGHRTFDALGSRVLDGDLEYSRILTALLTYEPIKQYIFTIKLIYLNESLQNSIKNNQVQSYFTLSIKL
ncbi:MAG: capsule assembly Wzi family protein [Bacteroidetes bacterium]|nr:capsule assembly Wzi family protein [Bacteroidota bacterium]